MSISQLPDFDEICGDGPLRMLMVEGNVVMLKERHLIERHLLMFTDIIILLRRNAKDFTKVSGHFSENIEQLLYQQYNSPLCFFSESRDVFLQWELHPEFGGIIYFGLVLESTRQESKGFSL
tara:strand:- start:1797 stop:2162 length:366 start_codon:yes stop_codon:yes gene_type:complete